MYLVLTDRWAMAPLFAERLHIPEAVGDHAHFQSGRPGDVEHRPGEGHPTAEHTVDEDPEAVDVGARARELDP